MPSPALELTSEGDISEEAGQVYVLGSIDNPEPRVFLSVCLNGSSCTALADSGADISVVSRRIVDSLGIEVNESSSVSVRGHGRSAVSRTLGTVILAVGIGGFTVPGTEFHVVDDQDINHEVILGANFMYQHYLAPSPAHGRLIYAPPNSSAEFVGSPARLYHPLYLQRNLKLKPRTLSYFSFEVVADPGQDVVFEPATAAKRKSIAMCRSIETVSPEKTVTLEILCYSEHPISLKKGLLLGHVCATEAGDAPGEVRETADTDGMSGSVADLFDWSKTELEEWQVGRVRAMIQAHSKAISQDDGDVGRVDLVAHHIKFVDPEQQPIRIPPRRFSGSRREGIRQEVEKMLKEGVIESSDSPWSAPVVPVVKSDGSIRLCVDYRALNKITYKDAFPLPNIEDALYNLHGMKYFSTLDLIRGYYQVPMAESSRPCTAFSTSDGHWQFKRMPFGLCNAPATFQRLMNVALSGFSWDRVMAYLDDILIMDASFEEHLDSFGSVLACLAKYGLKVKPQKCQLFRQKVQFLGHQVSVDGLTPDLKNVQAIVDFPVPRTVRQVHQFMGMVNFYRRFIPNCSVIARPLNKLLGGKRLQWTSECQSAFDQLREALVSPPVLSYPDFRSGEPFQLYTDASNTGVGACLLQVQSGIHRVIAYISTTFNVHELKYSVLDKELAAIRWAVKRLKPFLLGHRFIIYSDHKPLSYLQSRRHLDSRLARMLEELGEYDFEIRYVPGRCNVFADALSRAAYEEVVTLSEPPDKYMARFIESQVKGGGDTLFRCFSLFSCGTEEEHEDLRQRVVDEILLHPDRYSADPNPSWKRKMRLIRCPGAMPVHECVQAFSNLLRAPVLVYEDQIGFVRYEPFSLMPDCRPCFVRSYDGVYFTLLSPVEPVDDILGCRDPVPSNPEVLDLYELEDDREEDFEVDTSVEFVLLECRQLRSRLPLSEVRKSRNVDDCDSDRPARKVKQVRFNPVVSCLEFQQTGSDGSAGNLGTDVGAASWREALNVDAVHAWQSASKQLQKLKQLFRDFGGDLDKVRRTCLCLKYLRKYAKHVSSISVNHEGLLVRRVELKQKSLTVFPYLVPFAALGDLVREAHERNGHIGREKLKRLVLPHVFHPNLYIVVADVTRSCAQCMRCKPFSAKVTSPVLRIQTQRAFELVSIDLMELPHATGQFKYVLNAVDHHTKWLASRPLRNKMSVTCARAFDSILAGLPGIPESVISDNGTEFSGRPFVELLRHYNINQKFTTPYTPQSNGLVERVNKSLVGILTGLCGTPTEWDRYLPEAVIIYNNTYHREIERTPAESFAQVASKLPIGPVSEPFWKAGSSSFEPYPVGSLVGRKILGPRGVSQKLNPRYEGPFVVEKVHSNGKSYVLYSEEDPDRKLRAHYDQLRPWTKAPKYLQQSQPYRFSSVEVEDYPCDSVDTPNIERGYVFPIPGLDPTVFDLIGLDPLLSQ